ncbi:hypothetical protein ACJJTC_001076 [Scirpophaga incertulas]
MSSRDRDIGRKWESGSAKRKRKAERTATNQVLSLNMMKFLNQTASGSTEPSESIASTSTQQTSEEPLENVPDALNTESERQADVELGSSSSQSKFDAENLVLTSSSQEDQIDIDSPIRSDDASAIAQQVLVISDPGLWTFPITDTQRLDIVRSGPTQQLNSGDEYYPKGDDNDNRHFSNFYFSRKLNNGETQHRRWLVYSNSQNKVYCFPCRLFSNSQTQMVQGGCCDWKHLSNILHRHENTKEHMAHMFQWLTLEKGINQGKTIDQENERLIQFIVSLHVWYEILSRVNIISKLWQSVEIHLSIALEHLHTFCEWIKEYRETGFEKSLSDVRTFSERSSYDLPKEFRNKRVTKKKRMFDYESSDEPIQSPKIRYQTDFFYAMIDSIIINMELKFTSFKQHLEDFGFLYNLSELKNMPQEQILKHCNDLHNVLRVGESSDFQPFELYEELNTMIPNLPIFIKDVKQLLSYITENSLKEIYPNIYIVIRILLTIPVSTASAERSFSKLKLIKNYLRNTMSQERLSALAVLSIESDLASRLNYDTIIKEFSKIKSRKFLFI